MMRLRSTFDAALLTCRWALHPPDFQPIIHAIPAKPFLFVFLRQVHAALCASFPLCLFALRRIAVFRLAVSARRISLFAAPDIFVEHLVRKFALAFRANLHVGLFTSRPPKITPALAAEKSRPQHAGPQLAP